MKPNKNQVWPVGFFAAVLATVVLAMAWISMTYPGNTPAERQSISPLSSPSPLAAHLPPADNLPAK